MNKSRQIIAYVSGILMGSLATAVVILTPSAADTPTTDHAPPPIQATMQAEPHVYHDGTVCPPGAWTSLGANDELP